MYNYTQQFLRAAVIMWRNEQETEQRFFLASAKITHVCTALSLPILVHKLALDLERSIYTSFASHWRFRLRLQTSMCRLF